MAELNENEKLLIQLEQQLKNGTENHKKLIDLVDAIFSKIDTQSKEYADLKSKLDTLKEVDELKFVELGKDIEEFKTFKKEEFTPISNAVQQFKGASKMVKFVYPLIALIIQIAGIAITWYLATPAG